MSPASPVSPVSLVSLVSPSPVAPVSPVSSGGPGELGELAVADFSKWQPLPRLIIFQSNSLSNGLFSGSAKGGGLWRAGQEVNQDAGDFKTVVKTAIYATSEHLA